MTFNTGLARKGPGLLVRDIVKSEAEDIKAVLAEILTIGPDIAVLQGIDFDHDLVALKLIRDRLETEGLDLPHIFAGRPNTGRPTPFDLDRDGRFGRGRDKQGFGYFQGYDGIAILSRFPILLPDILDLSGFLWRDLPGADLPQTSQGSYYTQSETEILRLHTTGAWIVPVETGAARLNLMIAQAGPPVFDGPEDRNGKRNRDEIRFWSMWLNGEISSLETPQDWPFVFAGGLNSDPFDGESAKDAIRELLRHPKLQDPRPTSDGALAAADADHRGPPEQDTADWPNGKTEDQPGPGNLRVDYILPSADLRVVNSGVAWGAIPPLGFGSRHRPVWVEVELD